MIEINSEVRPTCTKISCNDILHKYLQLFLINFIIVSKEIIFVRKLITFQMKILYF